MLPIKEDEPIRLFNKLKINYDTEIQLDSFRLPHPILGKATLGEFAIFTFFHTLHHFEVLKSKLDYSINCLICIG
jgi:hypothetical protein